MTKRMILYLIQLADFFYNLLNSVVLAGDTMVLAYISPKWCRVLYKYQEMGEVEKKNEV